MNLYDQTLDAIAKFDELRHPPLDAWIKSIDPVLVAADQPPIGSDKVESISILNDELIISTSYSVMCCDQMSSMCLPLSIVQASDPVQEATRFQLQKKLSDAKSRLAESQDNVAKFSGQIGMLEAKLSSLPVPQPEALSSHGVLAQPI